jgi:hypothetical protein
LTAPVSTPGEQVDGELAHYELVAVAQADEHDPAEVGHRAAERVE